VPPFGHKTHLRVFIDPDLLQWHDVFGIVEFPLNDGHLI